MCTLLYYPNNDAVLIQLDSSTEASWHADYRDTAYVYIGGLPFDLSEGDVVTIFSQFGEPTYINLIRDKETGKSKGFAFLKYEDQRSTDLAVDNLGGATVMGRVLKVDHTRYKKKDDEDGIDLSMGIAADNKKEAGSESEEERKPILTEERELAALIRDHDEDDPMKEYLIKEKKEEVALALARMKGDKAKDRKDRHKHHHRHHKHRSRRRSDESNMDGERRKRHRSDRKRSRSP